MNEPVFALIKSLDKTEKGYFKKFASRYGSKASGNDYLKLFDLLDKADSYDEEKVKASFAREGKKFNLSAQKNYLYAQLLRALRSYSSGKSVIYEITESTLDIHNLIDRGLTEQALDLITECQNKATTIESYEWLLSLKTIEESVKLRMLGRYSMDDIQQLKSEVRAILQSIEQERTLSDLLFEIKLLDDERGVTEISTEDLQNRADRVMLHPLLQDADKLSRRGRLMYYSTYHIYAAICNDDKTSLNYLKLVHEVYKQMELDVRTTYSYLANVSNVIMTALNINDIEEANHYLRVLEKQRFKDTTLEIYRKRVYAKNLLMCLVVNSLTGNTKDAVYDAEQHYLATKPESAGNNNLMSSYYLAILFYSVNEPDKALEWLNTTMEHKKTSFINVQAYCRIVCAHIYYDLDAPSLMESSLQSAQYFIKKNNLPSNYLKQCIMLLNKLKDCPKGAETRAQLKKMQETINELYVTELKNENTYFHDFNLAVWCNAKLQGRTYGEQLVSEHKKEQAAVAAI